MSRLAFREYIVNTSPNRFPPRSRRSPNRGVNPVVAAVRQLTDRDFDAVDRIQRSAYSPDFLEDLAVFADKFARYPAGCWVAQVNGQIVGYLFSLPGYFSAPPCLNTLLDEQVCAPDCYFIHDVAVHPAQCGQGVAQLLIESASTHAAARGFSDIALVAVQDSRGFWERKEFQLVPESVPAVEAVRRSYGSQAHYMIRGSAEPCAAPDRGRM